MSRIGKKLIPLPEGVTVTLSGSTISVKGAKGTLSMHIPHGVTVQETDRNLTVLLSDVSGKDAPALWGLTRALLSNMVHGVTKGYTESLEINGVGFKAAIQGQKLTLNVGFSHPVVYTLPNGIAATVEKNVITITGIDKQQLGQVTAEIRAIKKPEPYKGKGIKYSAEVIRRKVGKVMKSAG